AFGLEWLLFFFALHWIGDTAAYFVGKNFGRKKLMPWISPKKTVEGAAAHLLSAAALALVASAIFMLGPWYQVFIVALLISLSAQLGDLFESFLKRAVKIKDSGKVLPGDGGFLDRFDGVVFSLPVLYTCLV